MHEFFLNGKSRPRRGSLRALAAVSLAASLLLTPGPAHTAEMCVGTADDMAQLFSDCGDALCVWQLESGADLAGVYSYTTSPAAAAEHRIVGGYSSGCAARVAGTRSEIGRLDLSVPGGAGRLLVRLEAIEAEQLILTSRQNPTFLDDVVVGQLEIEHDGNFRSLPNEAGATIRVSDSRFSGPVSIDSTWAGGIFLTGNVFDDGRVRVVTGTGSTDQRRIEIEDNTFRNGFAAPGETAAAGLSLDFRGRTVDAVIRRNRFQDNWTWGNGSALAGHSDAGTVEVSANVFTRNGAWEAGAGLWFSSEGGLLRIVHNLFQENLAATGNPGGAGAYIQLVGDEPELLVANNILRGNQAALFGDIEAVGVDLAIQVDADGNAVEAAATVVANAIGTEPESLFVAGEAATIADNIPGPALDLAPDPDPAAPGFDAETYTLSQHSPLVDGGIRLYGWTGQTSPGGRPRSLGPAPDIGPVETAPMLLRSLSPTFGGGDQVSLGCSDDRGGCRLSRVDTVSGIASDVVPDLIRAGSSSLVIDAAPLSPLTEGARPGIAWLELATIGGATQSWLRARDFEGTIAGRWLQTLPYDVMGQLLVVESAHLTEPLIVTTGTGNKRVLAVVYEADAPLVDDFQLMQGTIWTVGPAAVFDDADSARACVTLQKDDGIVIIRCLDLASQELESKITVLRSGWLPVELVNVGDLNDDGRSEAVLLVQSADRSRFAFYTVDLAAGAILKKRAHRQAWQPLALSADGDLGPYAVLLARRQSDGRLLQRVLDPITGKLSGKGNLLTEGWQGRAIRPAPATDGDGSASKPDAISLAIEDSNAAVAAERRLARGKRVTTTFIVDAAPEPAPESTLP